MSENVTQFPGATATDTLMPKRVTAVIADINYPLTSFTMAKTIRTFAYIAELVKAASVSEVMNAATQSREDGEFAGDRPVALGFIQKLINVLPSALSNSSPTLYRLLGLLVTPNAKLYKWTKDEEDIDKHLYDLGEELAHTGTNEEIINLVVLSSQVIGVETVVKQLPNLMRFVNGATN